MPNEIDALYEFIAAQFNDNTAGDITPARARAVFGRLLGLVNSLANRGPNDSPSGLMGVRHLTRLNNPDFDPVSDHALDELDTTLTFIGGRCFVEFEGKDFIMRYDGAPRPGGPSSGPQTWRDGRMAYPTPLVPCKWVAEDSPSAQVKDYTEFPARFNFPAGFHIGAYVAGQSSEQFFKRHAPGGEAPAPTTGGDATYWELVSGTDVPMPAAAVLFRVISYADALSYDSDDALPRGQECLITNRPGGSPDVRGTFSEFFPAAMQYATLEGQAGSVRFDLTSNTTTDTSYDDTAVRAQLTDLENEVGGFETVQQQQGGWIGNVANLLTTSKTNLVASINELLGKIGVNTSNITANTNAIAAHTTSINANTALLRNAIDYGNETTLTANTLGGAYMAGKAYALASGVEVELFDLSVVSAGNAIFGRCSFFRAVGPAPATVSCGLFDGGQASYTLAAGDALLVRAVSPTVGYTAQLRTSGSTASGPYPSLTNPQVDDVNKYFRATLPANFRTAAAEYSVDGGTSWTVATEALRAGDVLSAPVSGNKAIGTVQWRIRADLGRAASAAVSNATAFTGALMDVVLQEDSSRITRVGSWSPVTGAAAGSFFGASVLQTMTLGDYWELTIMPGEVAISLQGYKSASGSYFRLDKNGTSVYTGDQYAGGETREQYLVTSPANRLPIAQGDVIRFTRTNSNFTTAAGGATNVANYLDQITLHAS